MDNPLDPKEANLLSLAYIEEFFSFSDTPSSMSALNVMSPTELLNGLIVLAGSVIIISADELGLTPEEYVEKLRLKILAL
jgi:hypothetical protein